MQSSSAKGAAKNERILVLAVDVDNDLYRKTGISGPIMGRVQNFNAASQLVLADPEETDSNTMFQAVKLYDDLKKDGYLVSVATVTGSESEGYAADREVARQLDMVLAQYKSDACIFVTDGASDSRVLPTITSRIKISSTKIVTMKQAESLENTYFVLFEKLKEPHYARIVFGIPALLLLLFAISYYIGTGWELPVAIIGAYLVVKGFGLEDMLINSFKGFGFSIERLSFVFYLSSIVFFIASLFVGFGSFYSQSQIAAPLVQRWAYGIEGFLLLLPIMLGLYLTGRMIDSRRARYLFRSFKYGIYIGSSVILWVLLYSFTAWIIGQIYFSQFLLYTIVAVAIGIIISSFSTLLRRSVIKGKKIKDKLVINELGATVGKVTAVDVKRGLIRINTNFGNPIIYSIDRIVELSDKVVIK